MEELEDLKNQIKILKNQLEEANLKINSLQFLNANKSQKIITSTNKNDSIVNEASTHQLVLESLVEGVIFLNPQGEVQFINDGARKITGVDFSEFQRELPNTRSGVVDENYNPIAIEAQPSIISLKTKKPVKNFQVGVTIKENKYQWLLVNAQPVFNSQNKFLGVVTSFIDITDIKIQRDELKQAKLNLEISENSLKMAQEISHMGSWIWDIKSDSLEWSEEIYNIFQLSSNEASVKSRQIINERIIPEDKMIVTERNNKVRIFTQERIEPIEFRIKLDDGSVKTLWSHVGKIICDENGNPDIAVGVVLDITERKKEEDKKLFEHSNQQALRLESLRFLAGGIAHDFNNLLGGIYGYIDLALNETSGSLVQNYLKGALKSMVRARSLTDQLLTFTESGLPNREITLIDKLVIDTANFVLSGSSITCDFYISKDLWYCAIDKGQISQVIENIVLNAIQSMKGKGKISIFIENAIITESNKSNKYVKITIRDTGLGMTSDVQDHLFEPFFTTKKEGHGLGLATTYSIIKKHDGLIKVESELNKGSTFSIFIPATNESVISNDMDDDQFHQGKGLILILDDEEDIRDILSINLQKLGYSVITRKNGKEILEVLDEPQIGEKLISLFLDVTIPGGLGGKDLIEGLRKKFPTLPIIVISGYSDDPIINRPQDYGFTASLRKPFIYDELKKLLSKITT